MKNLKKIMKENLVASFCLDNTPIGNKGSKVLLDAELFKSEDVSKCIYTKIAIDSDDYLDLLITKGNYKGDGTVYFSSNIIDDFEILSEKIERKEISEIVVTSGVVAAFDEEGGDYELLKEIV
jgi:hypothetical protein